MGAAAISTDAVLCHFACRQRRAVSQFDALLCRRRNSHHVGLGYVVDTIPADARLLEIRHSPRTSVLYAPGVERGVSNRHVFNGNYAVVAGERFCGLGWGGACCRLDCDCGMGRRARSTVRGVLARFSGVYTIRSYGRSVTTIMNSEPAGLGFGFSHYAVSPSAVVRLQCAACHVPSRCSARSS